MIFTLFLFKTLFYFLSIILLIATVGFIAPSNEVDNAISSMNESSIIQINEHVINVGIFINNNQASSFNHLNQTSFDYSLVALLALFLVGAVNYQWFKPVGMVLPWYIVLRRGSCLNISAWKTSNLQYKIHKTCR